METIPFGNLSRTIIWTIICEHWYCQLPNIYSLPSPKQKNPYFIWSNDASSSEITFPGLPWWSSGWESTCQYRRHRYNPWSGRIPTCYLATRPMWHSYWDHMLQLRKFSGFPGGSVGKESTCNAGDPGSIPGSRRSPGEGKGYPLQCSGLDNSMDCIVHGVTKSQTRLSDFTFTAALVPRAHALKPLRWEAWCWN